MNTTWECLCCLVFHIAIYQLIIYTAGSGKPVVKGVRWLPCASRNTDRKQLGVSFIENTIFCTLKTCKKYFRARQYYELSLVGRSKLQMPVSIDYLPFFSWQSQHPSITTPCFNVNLHDVLFESLFSSS